MGDFEDGVEVDDVGLGGGHGWLLSTVQQMKHGKHVIHWRMIRKYKTS